MAKRKWEWREKGHHLKGSQELIEVTDPMCPRMVLGTSDSKMWGHPTPEDAQLIAKAPETKDALDSVMSALRTMRDKHSDEWLALLGTESAPELLTAWDKVKALE